MSSTNRILVTGVTSGLGKYIYENISDCVGMTRENRHYVLKDEYDLIIHCAFSSERGNDITDYFEYIDSSEGQILLSLLPHYISSDKDVINKIRSIDWDNKASSFDF